MFVLTDFVISAASNPSYNPGSEFPLCSDRCDSTIRSRDNQFERDNWETNYFCFCVSSEANFLHWRVLIHAGITGPIHLVL